MASLVLSLVDAGFDATILCVSAPPGSLDLLAAMRDAGVGLCHSNEVFLGLDFDILLDTDGALLAEYDQPLLGGTVATPNIAKQLTDASAPVVHIAASRLLENCALSHGVGQACVSGFLDITNLQIAGAQILVLGYEAVGEGVAHYAAAYGARVIVCEEDPVRLVKANMDGHSVSSLEAAIPKAAAVFNTRFEGAGLSMAQLKRLPSGAFLCSATAHESALPLARLEALAPGKEVREFVTQHDLPSGGSVKLVCGGLALQHDSALGLPLEYADIMIAAQLHAIMQIAEPECNLRQGIHPLPKEVEDALASAFLEGELRSGPSADTSSED
ncbi:MAG: hypothetical protein AAFY42_02485 [Pseudomonadota bacterium]